MATQITRAADLPRSGIVVVDFFATWCGPCKRIAPQFESLAKQFPTVKFVKVDIDAVADLADTYQIRAIPTFLVFQEGSQILRVNGADITKIEIQLNKLTGW
jgi:thioredoxin 1